MNINKNRSSDSRQIYIQLLLGLTMVLIALLQKFPLGITVFELLGAFAHFTFALSALALVFSLIFRFRVLVVSASIALLVCGSTVAPHFHHLKTISPADVMIGQFNLYHNNPTPNKTIAFLEEVDADIFTIQELNSDWKSLIHSALEARYPYRIEEPWSRCCYGIALYSKFPVIKSRVIELERTPVIVAEIDMRGEHIQIISLHTRPPVAPNETPERNRQLEKVARMAAESEIPCIVLGDFNIVPWDGTFKQFLKTGNLTAVRDGFQATYPMDFRIPLIPIDHITYSGNLTPTSCEAVTIPGSDHRGLVVGFDMNN